MALGILFGVGGGLAMFALRGRATEQALDGASTVMMAIPEFLWAILLILFRRRQPEAVALHRPAGARHPATAEHDRLPAVDALISGRFEALRSALLHLILPALALAIGLAPLVMRVLRSSLFETYQDDYVAQARPARPLRPPHPAAPRAAQRGAADDQPDRRAGRLHVRRTVLVEMIFAYPGLGALMVDAVRNHDLPVIQAVALIYCVLVLGINAVVDVAYLAVNPRLRLATT